MITEYRIIVHAVLGSPHKSFDWCAVDDNTYDGQETDPIGYGSTPREAIDALMDQIEEKLSTGLQAR